MKIDVKHVAKLANLTVTDEEIKKFEPQLSSIVGYIDQLSELYTKNTDTTNHVTGLSNVVAEDKPTESISSTQALPGKDKTYNGLFIVNAVLED